MRSLFFKIMLVAVVAGCTKSSPMPAKSAPQSTPTATAPPVPDKSAPQSTATTSTPSADEKITSPTASAAAAPPVAEKATGKFAVGDPAPNFKGLVGIDDKAHSLDEYT